MTYLLLRTSGQGLKEQFSNRLKHFSSASCITSWKEEAPRRMLLTWWKTGSDQGEDISGKLSKKGKPTMFLSSQSTTGLLYNDVFKTHSLKNGMQIKGFLWFCFNGVQLNQPIKHYEDDPCWVLLFCPPPNPPPQPSLPASWLHTPICLKISWLAASHRGGKVLVVKHNAMHRPVSHKNKATWITCMPSFVSMYQL